jgi:inward rectifier potassium channel
MALTLQFICLNIKGSLMSQRGHFKVIRKNIPSHLNRDLYHDLLTLGWEKSILLFLSFFFLLNSCFATLYWWQSSSIQHSDGTWLSAFFFSVQTLGTIGYGHLAPATTFANLLVTIEATLGMVIMAIFTGLFFAKFSRTYAKIEYTQKMVVTEFDGKKTLIFRMLNIRRNQIYDASVHVSLLKPYVSPEGIELRRFLDLKLVRSKVPLFALGINMMHVIDESSPLYGLGGEACIHEGIEIMVTTIGVDGTFGQTISAVHVYRSEDIVWNRNFKDMVKVHKDGTREIDYENFDALA